MLTLPGAHETIVTEIALLSILLKIRLRKFFDKCYTALVITWKVWFQFLRGWIACIEDSSDISSIPEKNWGLPFF